MEVRICCRLVTQELTLWPVGVIGHGTDSLDISPHTSSPVPIKIEREESTLLYSSLSRLSSQSSAVEAYDQNDALRGLQEPRNSATQAPNNIHSYPVDSYPQPNYTVWGHNFHEEPASGTQKINYTPHGSWNRSSDVRQVLG